LAAPTWEAGTAPTLAAVKVTLPLVFEASVLTMVTAPAAVRALGLDSPVLIEEDFKKVIQD
jgi:hypothetical protein